MGLWITTGTSFTNLIKAAIKAGDHTGPLNGADQKKYHVCISHLIILWSFPFELPMEF